MKIPHFIYKKYPRLRVVLSKRCRIYNEQLALVEQLEDKGRLSLIHIFVERGFITLGV